MILEAFVDRQALSSPKPILRFFEACPIDNAQCSISYLSMLLVILKVLVKVKGPQELSHLPLHAVPKLIVLDAPSHDTKQVANWKTKLCTSFSAILEMIGITFLLAISKRFKPQK